MLRMRNVRVYRGAECGSDHYLLKGNVLFKYINREEEPKESKNILEEKLDKIEEI